MTTTPTTPATTPTTTAKNPWLSANHANHATNPHGRRAHAHRYTCAQARARALQPSRGSRGLSGLKGLWRGRWRGLEFSRVVLQTGGANWTKSTERKSANSWTVTTPSGRPASRWIPACRVTVTYAANGADASSVERAQHAAPSTTCHDLPAMRLGVCRNGERGRGHGRAGVPLLPRGVERAGARAVRQRIDAVPLAGTVQGEGVVVNFTRRCASGYTAPAAPHWAAGFSSPKWSGEEPQALSSGFFHALVRPVLDGPGGEPQGSPVLHRSANPFGSVLPFSSGRRFIQRTGAHTMSTIDKGALALDRNIAAHINPFIGFNSEETLDRCADTVDELGYVISAASNNCHEMSMDSLFRIFETISFALRYEQEQLSKSKEASHG